MRVQLTAAEQQGHCRDASGIMGLGPCASAQSVCLYVAPSLYTVGKYMDQGNIIFSGTVALDRGYVSLSADSDETDKTVETGNTVTQEGEQPPKMELFGSKGRLVGTSALSIRDGGSCHGVRSASLDRGPSRLDLAGAGIRALNGVSTLTPAMAGDPSRYPPP